MNSDFDPNQYLPVLNDWFKPNVEYVGWGRAEFSDPDGFVEGQTKARFSDDGQQHISMRIEKISNGLEIAHLFNHFAVNPTEMPWKMYAAKRKNSPCTRFVIETEQGIFELCGRIQYHHQGQGIIVSDPDEFTFSSYGHSPYSQYDVKNANPAKYWVMPLFNYVVDLGIDLHHSNPHIMRIFPTPDIPPNLNHEQFTHAVWAACSHNAVINFQYKEEWGFIECLPDYRDRLVRLVSPTDQVVTAIMVGNVGKESIDIDDLDSWFPFNFLSVLGLTIGIPIAANGIEFRDAQGGLVRRIHAHYGETVYSANRHCVISELVHRGTGELLSAYAKFLEDDTNKLDLSATIEQLARSGLYGNRFPDTLFFVCRALDSLYAAHLQAKLLNRQRVGAYLYDEYDQVKQIVETFNAQIVKMCDRADRIARKNANDPLVCQKADALRIIKNKTSNILNTPIDTDNFGSQVAQLLDRYAFSDAMIMDAQYNADPIRYRKSSWVRSLSDLRNKMAHRGKLSTKNYEQLYDLAHTTRHLHDIAIRLVLKILGYTGEYQPTMAYGNDPQTVDWVTQETKPEELGYVD